MAENISLINQIKQNETGQMFAVIDRKWSYKLTFDVIGECELEIKLLNAVTNKVSKTLTPHNEFMDGSYSFEFISDVDGVLVYNFHGIGEGMVVNIKVIKGGA